MQAAHSQALVTEQNPPHVTGKLTVLLFKKNNNRNGFSSNDVTVQYNAYDKVNKNDFLLTG